MGLLLDYEHRLDGQPEAFTVLHVVLPRDVGERFEGLSPERREAIYQKILDAIRARECPPDSEGKRCADYGIDCPHGGW